MAKIGIRNFSIPVLSVYIMASQELFSATSNLGELVRPLTDITKMKKNECHQNHTICAVNRAEHVNIRTMIFHT